LLRGGTTHLRHLDLSRNFFSTKKGKEVPLSFKQYFTSALALRTIILSHCKITPEALKYAKPKNPFPRNTFILYFSYYYVETFCWD